MIPIEHRNPRVEYLEKVLAGLGDNPSSLAGLKSDDLRLIGSFIQIYNYIELNLRRSIEIFARSNLLDDAVARKHHRISSKLLVQTLKAAVVKLDPSIEDIDKNLKKLDEIEYRRSVRNLLAHWAAKRIPGEDAIVLMSKDGLDEKQISGEDQSRDDYVRTAIFDLADLRGLVQHIVDYEVWLATKTVEWHKRYVELK